MTCHTKQQVLHGKHKSPPSCGASVSKPLALRAKVAAPCVCEIENVDPQRLRFAGPLSLGDGGAMPDLIAPCLSCPQTDGCRDGFVSSRQDSVVDDWEWRYCVFDNLKTIF